MLAYALIAEIDWGTFIGGLVSALVLLGGGIVAWYLSLKKDTREGEEEQVKLAEKRQKQKDARERRIADEYRDLYIEVKQELISARRQHRRCDRKMARMEAALMAAGIPLPEEPEDSDEPPNPPTPLPTEGTE